MGNEQTMHKTKKNLKFYKEKKTTQTSIKMDQTQMFGKLHQQVTHTFHNIALKKFWRIFGSFDFIPFLRSHPEVSALALTTVCDTYMVGCNWLQFFMKTKATFQTKRKTSIHDQVIYRFIWQGRGTGVLTLKLRLIYIIS